MKPTFQGEQEALQKIAEVVAAAQKNPSRRVNGRSVDWLLRTTNPMEKLNLCQIAGAAYSIPPKNYGGAEYVIAQLAEEQRRLGHSVALYAPGSSKLPGVIPTIPQAVLEGGRWEHQGSFSAHYEATLLHLLKTGGSYDFCIGHAADPYSWRVGGHIALLNSLGVPSFVFLHNMLDGPSRFFEGGKEQWQPTTQAADWYAQRYWEHIPLTAFNSVNRGTNLRLYPNTWFVAEVPLALSDNAFLAQRKRLNAVGIMGRVEKDKGQRDAEKFVRDLGEGGPDLFIAGPVRDPDYFAQLSIDLDLSNDPQKVASLVAGTVSVEQLIGAPSSFPRVVYLGPIGGDIKNNFLSAIKVAVAPIHWDEPGGTFHIEALAAGTPLVANNRGCVKDQLDPHLGSWGYYVPEGDELGFVHALKAALAFTNHAEIQQWAKEEVHVSKAAQRYDALIRFLIALWWEQGGWQI